MQAQAITGLCTKHLSRLSRRGSFRTQESGGAGADSPRVLEIDSCPHAVPFKGVRARQLGGQLSAGSGKGQSRRKTKMHVVGAREGVQSLEIAAGLYVR